MGVGTTEIGPCSGVKDQTQCWMHHGQVGIYSQGVAWAQVDWKWPRGGIKGRGVSG